MSSSSEFNESSLDFFFGFVKETLTVSSILNISSSFGSPFLWESVWTSFTLKEVLPTWINFSSRRIVYHFITHQWRFYAGSLSSKSDKPLIQLRVFYSTNEIQCSILFPPSQISFLIQHPKTRLFAYPLEFCHTTGTQIFRGTWRLAVILGHQMIHHRLRSWSSGPWEYSQWDDRETGLKVGCLRYVVYFETIRRNECYLLVIITQSPPDSSSMVY